MEIDIPIESQLAAPTQPSGSNALRIPLRPPRAKQTTTCPECGKVLLQKTLQRHIETSHTKWTALRCPQCPKTFYRKDHLLRHGREKHDDAAETVECVYCGKQVRQRYMNEHWKGRKCMSKHVVTTELGHHVSAESMADPLIIGACLVVTVSRLLFYRSMLQHPILIYPDICSRSVLCGILELRALAIRQMRKTISTSFDATPTAFSNFSLSAQMTTLIYVDFFLFGEDSYECRAHCGSLITLEYCDSHPTDYLLYYEEIFEHCWRRATQGQLQRWQIPLACFWKTLAPTTEDEYADGTCMMTTYVPRSLKSSRWLVKKFGRRRGIGWQFAYSS